jgi:hypothetical protein
MVNATEYRAIAAEHHRLAGMCRFATCQIAVVISRLRRGAAARPAVATETSVTRIRTASRVALISLALSGTMAWNGLLIFVVGRMIQLW